MDTSLRPSSAPPTNATHPLRTSAMPMAHRAACRALAQLGTRVPRRSLSTASSSFDVVVAGGAAVGSSVAYHLAASDPALKICVVEQDPAFVHASAMLSAGGIRQQFSTPANIQLSLYGVDFLRRLPTELSIPGEDAPDVQFKEQGYLLLASERGTETLRHNHATQRANGASGTTLLEPSELAQRFPWLNVDGIALGCLGEQGEGWFDPWAFVGSLRAKAKHMGVTFVKGRVASLSMDSAAAAGARKITSVRVDAADGKSVEIGAGAVVNAAGAFADNIVRMCGDDVAHLPVRARKRAIFSFDCRGGGSSSVPSSESTPLVVDPTGVYFRPEGPSGRFMVGVSPPPPWVDADCESNSDLESTDHTLFDELMWPALYERCNAFEAIKVSSSWSGFYDYNTHDQNAIIGTHPHVPNLILCNGFSGHGLQHSPGAGRAVAELVTTGGYQTVDVSCLGFERVLNGEPLFEKNVI